MCIIIHKTRMHGLFYGTELYSYRGGFLDIFFAHKNFIGKSLLYLGLIDSFGEEGMQLTICIMQYKPLIIARFQGCCGWDITLCYYGLLV